MTTDHSPTPHIVLTTEQARAIRATEGVAVELRDETGQHVGFASSSDCHAWPAEDIAIAKGRLAAPGPQYTTEQVLARLKSLEQCIHS